MSYPPPPPGSGDQPYDSNQSGYGQGPPPGGYGQAPGGYNAPQGQGTNGLAIGALITGILGILGNCFCFGGILSPVAIVLGVMGKKKADQSNGQVGGRGMANAGIILGIIGTLLLIAWVAFFIWAISTGEELNYQWGTDMS